MLSSIDVSALDTGDIMLFSGKGLGSAIIRWFTGSDWNSSCLSASAIRTRHAAELRGQVERALMTAVPGLRATIELLPTDVEAHFDDPRDDLKDAVK